jgi:hypothetical protein
VRSRSLRPARVLTGALLLGAVGAALAPAGPDALVPFKLLAASAADQVYVAVVVDFGNGTTTSHCVPVSPGESDEQALSEVYPVVTNSSGLICDINGTPTSDTSQCLDTAGNNQFYYWSYWHGSTGTWEYSSVGPASYATSSGDVEGWRFQNPGPDSPDAPPPEASASYASICGAFGTTATTAPPAAPPAQTNTAPATSGVKGSAQPGRSTSTTGAAGTTSTSAAAGAHTPKTSNSKPSNSSAEPTVTNRAHQFKTKNALASASDRNPGPGGSPILPLVLIGAVIALLGALSYVRWHRRPAEE